MPTEAEQGGRSSYPNQPAWLLWRNATPEKQRELVEGAAGPSAGRLQVNYPSRTSRTLPLAGGGTTSVPIKQIPADFTRGFLCAVVPGDLGNFDMLEFSRVPTQVNEGVGTNLAMEKIGGRGFPAIQDNGGNGQTINLDLLFNDADIYDPKHSKHQGASANAARRWFQAYTIGHDGTGASMPVVEILYQMLDGNPVRVKIESAEMTHEHYLQNLDVPQSTRVQVRLVVYEPVLYVNPFKPRSVPATVAVTKRRSKKVGGCGDRVTPNQLPGVTTRTADAATETADHALKVLPVAGPPASRKAPGRRGML